MCVCVCVSVNLTLSQFVITVIRLKLVLLIAEKNLLQYNKEMCMCVGNALCPRTFTVVALIAFKTNTPKHTHSCWVCKGRTWLQSHRLISPRHSTISHLATINNFGVKRDDVRKKESCSQHFTMEASRRHPEHLHLAPLDMAEQRLESVSL